ncbi:MAG: L,D-transpeptidase family protein [Gemmatimonadaceae bacterium]
MNIRRLISAVALTLVAAGCSRDASGEPDRPESAAPWAPAALTSVKGVPAAEIETALVAALDGSQPEKISADQWSHTKNLYKAYGNKPLWLSSDGLHQDRAFALANSILQAEQDGMRMDAYPIGELARAMAGVQQNQRPTPQQLAQADVLLTASFASLGEDYLTGQIDPETVAQSWHIDVLEEGVDSALVRSLRNSALDKSIAAMRPQDPDYDALRKELDKYQRITASGGWPSVPRSEVVKPGEPMSAAVVTALRQRLAAEAIIPAEAAAAPTGQGTSSTYDRSLAGAVATFQSRHGIVVDSMLGKETFDALNKPSGYRAAQIAANLERMRWLPRTMGSRYIAVNVSAFRLDAYDEGKKTLEMRVIVGEDYEDKATPVFSDSMETVVFRPYWNVTDDIAAKEIFPKIAADPSYLSANNYEIYRDGGTRRVRQKPGEENSLGLVKFMFPNSFNIYLHDTPNRELFSKDVRAFSHGCIRVEKPNELAQWALGWDAARVDQAMKGSDNQTFRVPQPIPVFIIYGTAYMRDGQLYFGNDLYSRDAKMVEELFRAAVPAPQTVQAVQALRRIAARS